MKPIDCIRHVNLRKRKAELPKYMYMSHKSTLCSNVSYHVKAKNKMQRNLSICALKRGMM